jgi:CBS-domain-containing membrane protein
MMSVSVAGILKNRCRTTVAEPIGGRLAELSFIGVQFGLFRAQPGRSKQLLLILGLTRNVITVEEETPLNEIVELLEHHHIKRVPVLKDGKLSGIVSHANLLHGLANTIVDHHEPGAANDRQLRNELVKMLLAKHELDTALVNVTVTDGNVQLWGTVENASQATAAETAAKSMLGVKSLTNHLGTGPISGVPV